jgi:predicted DNA-binding transcriptional regulator YafY
VSRVASASADEAPARRRPGVDLAGLWQLLRARVEERPAPLRVVARVRRERLDLFRRMNAAQLAGEDGDDGDDGEWVTVTLRFAAVMAARPLLAFGRDVEVLSPPQVRADLAAVAAQVAGLYAGD